MRKTSIFRKSITVLLAISIITSLCILWLSPIFGIFSYAIDIVSHFSLQIAIVGILSTLLFTWVINKPIYLSVLTIMILPLIPHLPINRNYDNDLTSDHDIYYVNMNYLNEESDDLLEQIDNQKAEVVVIIELTPEVKDILSKKYSNNIVKTQHAFSCGIFTNKEFLSAYVLNVEYPTCVMEFADYTIITTHPMPPYNNELWVLQQSHFQSVLNLFNTHRDNNKKPIILGDFNSTRYSGVYKKYFGDLKAKSTNYTWNISSPILSIPIDHALTKDFDLEIKLQDTTSDHTALLIDIQ
jgi:endonuclease/exonuclease/phosphatase (EEP) superfamily protein YafD